MVLYIIDTNTKKLIWLGYADENSIQVSATNIYDWRLIIEWDDSKANFELYDGSDLKNYIKELYGNIKLNTSDWPKDWLCSYLSYIVSYTIDSLGLEVTNSFLNIKKT